VSMSPLEGFTHALPLGIIAISGVVLSGVVLSVVAFVLVARRRRRPAERISVAGPGRSRMAVIKRDIFSQEEADDDEPRDSCPAVAIAIDSTALDAEAATNEPFFQVDAVGRTDRGKKRRHNEDSILVSLKQGLCVVADGMGGERGGSNASRTAVETIAEALEKHTFANKPHAKLPPAASEVAHAVQMACARIREAAKRDPELSKMGTTVVAARFLPETGRLYVGHVGDSRCYRFRQGALEQITSDHTMASLGVTGEGGQFLSRAVGPRSTVLTDVLVAKPRIGDVYLLCSDGLTKAVPDDLIRDVLDICWELPLAADRLVALANKRGGPDNVSVVLARVSVYTAEA
jgi:PPM family protein phosphatase